MKCSNCGAENANDSIFCFNCGASVANNPQTQYPADQSQEMPMSDAQYGYDQAQYGYVQPQYGYEQQPAQGYEQQPAQPPKKGKSGAIIAVLIVVVVLLVLGIVGYVGYQEGWFNELLNKEQTEVVEEPTGPIIQSTSKENTPFDGGTIQVKRLKSKSGAAVVEGSIKPSKLGKDADYTGMFADELADDPDAHYFIVRYHIKNTSSEQIDFDNLFIEGKFNDKIALNWRVYYESADSTRFEDDSIIDPGDIKTVCFVCSVSNKDASEFKEISLRFGYDKEFSAKPITKGEKACDYIFEFVASPKYE